MRRLAFGLIAGFGLAMISANAAGGLPPGDVLRALGFAVFGYLGLDSRSCLEGLDDLDL